MTIFLLFRHSFTLLAEHPKLFLPKLLISLLYGFAMLAAAPLAIGILFGNPTIQHMQPTAAFGLLLFSGGLLIYVFIVSILDILVNAMYPTMIDSLKSGSISFKKAFRHSMRKFFVVVPAVVVVELLLAVPFALLSLVLVITGNTAALFLPLFLLFAVAFLLTVLFYLVYPVAVLESKSFPEALLTSTRLLRCRTKSISLAAVVPFIVSSANFILALLASNLIIFSLFFLIRILTAVFYTYHMVLNPVVYFHLEELS